MAVRFCCLWLGVEWGGEVELQFSRTFKVESSSWKLGNQSFAQSILLSVSYFVTGHPVKSLSGAQNQCSKYWLMVYRARSSRSFQTLYVSEYLNTFTILIHLAFNISLNSSICQVPFKVLSFLSGWFNGDIDSIWIYDGCFRNNNF